MSAINELHALCIELPENTGPFSSADHRCYLAVVHDEDLGYRVLGRQHPFFSATGLMQHICAARAIDTVERMLLVQGRAVSPEAYIQRWRTLLARPRTLDQLAMHDRLRVGASFQWRRRPGQGSVKARWSQPPFVTFGELLQAHGCAAERQDDGNETLCELHVDLMQPLGARDAWWAFDFLRQPVWRDDVLRQRLEIAVGQALPTLVQSGATWAGGNP